MPARGELCPDGDPPGPAEAESWDDWGPFYTAMYAQHVGLDSSTVEMCKRDAVRRPARRARGASGSSPSRRSSS